MTDVLIWRLAEAGTCGVSDHSRGFVHNLGGRIVDDSRGQRCGVGLRVAQYVPTSWEQTRGWAGRLAERLRDQAPERNVLYVHELARSFAWRPRGLVGWLADLTALRVVLPHVRRVVVTTQARQRALRALADRWELELDITVLGAQSNVHTVDPPAEPRSPVAGAPVVAVFARSTEPYVGRWVGQSVAALLRRVPGARVVLLGGRRSIAEDHVLLGLDEARCLGRIEITGRLSADALAARLGSATVGLMLANTGLGGRRGTMGAYLAAGLPVVGNGGPDTDDSYRATPGVRVACESASFSADVVGDALAESCTLAPVAWQRRSLAAREQYLKHASWSALDRWLRPTSSAPHLREAA